MSEKSKEQQRSLSQEKLSDAWVSAIFEEFHGRFGNAFFTKFATGELDEKQRDVGMENAKNTWAKRLADYTPDEIARGIKAVYPYPPDVDVFRSKCRDYEASFNEAIQQMHLREKGQDQWSNPAIYWAAVAMGSDLMSMTYKQVEKRWEAALNKAVQDVRSGISDSVIPKRVKPSGYLSAPKREGNHSEVAKRELAKIAEIFKQEPKWKKDKTMRQVAQHVEVKGAA